MTITHASDFKIAIMLSELKNDMIECYVFKQFSLDIMEPWPPRSGHSACTYTHMYASVWVPLLCANEGKAHHIGIVDQFLVL